jgi:hypothetical protein
LSTSVGGESGDESHTPNSKISTGSFEAHISERVPGGGAQQRLAAARERHDAGGERRGETLDLRTYGSPGNVLRRVFAKGDRAYMDADPGGESKAGKCLMVGERVAGRVSRIVEQKEEAVGTSNLAAAVESEEVARPAVVLGPDLRRAGIAQALDHARTVHHVGEEEGAHGHSSGSRSPVVSRQSSGSSPTGGALGCTTVAKANTDH